VPILKQFPPTQKKPGNRFFIIAIVVGLLVMAGIWLNETLPHSKATISRPVTTNVPISSAKKISAPTSVFVMNKTNSANKTASVLVATSAPPMVVPKTNVVPQPTNAIQNSPVISSEEFAARPVQNVLEAQVALARLGISSGSIDGVIGSQTRAALRAFQQTENLPLTGELDYATRSRLLLTAPLYTEFLVTTNELARLQPLGTNWIGKSRQTRLDYETILEMAAEKSCAHPAFLKRLNASVNWTNFPPNTALRILNVGKIKAKDTAAYIRIRLAEKILEAFDAQTNLLAHFPCSIARRVEKRPVGELHVTVIAPNPDYTFSPENFPESAEARQIKTRLILPPGPNNPVGTVWIGLDKPGYGIHGTPQPEQVGRTESHGCFRLANWNAEFLLQLVRIGTPVFVEP
jgi:lipoprotein-anchoring transpeptidase ErfK/SrfK